MPNRYEIAGQARFLTFSCHKRLPLFQNDKIKDRFVTHLESVKQESQYRLLAWVVMPEHVHLLVTPKLPAVPMNRFLMMLKRSFAKEALQRWRELDAPILDRLADTHGHHRFWLKGGGYDRTIRSIDEYHRKIRYIEENPIRRGLAQHKDEWR